MSYGKALRLLCVHLWRWDRKGVVVAFAFSLYMGATMSFNMNAMFSGGENPDAIAGIIDWLLVAIMPIMGMCMSRTIFSIWRDDSYTKRIAVLRAYPIPLPVIIGSRVVQSVVMIPFNVTVMLGLIYALSPDLREQVPGLRWMVFGILWICYSLIVNALILWLELGHSGRRYVSFYLIGIVTATAIVIALSWRGIHPFLEVLEWTKLDAAPAIILCAIGCAIAALWLGYRATLRKIRTRSIAF